MEVIEILETAVKALDSKKGQNIRAVKVDDLTVIADYFVIATASSSTQVRALAEEVEYQLDLKNQPVHHIEGRSTNWILLASSSSVKLFSCARNTRRIVSANCVFSYTSSG